MITMTDDKLEGEGRNVMKHWAGIFLQMLTKITKNLGEYSGCPGRDPNVVLLEYEYSGRGKGKGTGKRVPVHATNAYGGRYSFTHS
jgi:hypothetical protein